MTIFQMNPGASVFVREHELIPTSLSNGKCTILSLKPYDIKVI